MSEIQHSGFAVHSSHPARRLIETIIRTEVDFDLEGLSDQSGYEFLCEEIDKISSNPFIEPHTYAEICEQYVAQTAGESTQASSTLKTESEVALPPPEPKESMVDETAAEEPDPVSTPEPESEIIEEIELAGEDQTDVSNKTESNYVVVQSIINDMTLPLRIQGRSLILFDEVWSPLLLEVATTQGFKSQAWQKVMTIAKTQAWVLTPKTSQIELDKLVSKKIGFEKSFPVTGQTYPRKIDSQVLTTLGGISESSHKAGNDLRIAAAWGELEEPFETDQVGSSAMPYKRNPMRAERMCGLSRFVMGLQQTASQTAAVQWYERTLDDSAPRRLVLPQAFLATDAVLVIYSNIAGGLVVLPGSIRRNLEQHIPFLASERLLMAATTAGGDRQELHEAIRRHSHAATAGIRDGRDNDLVERLTADPLFQEVDLHAALTIDGLEGRASVQVDEFLDGPVEEALKNCPERTGESELRV